MKSGEKKNDTTQIVDYLICSKAFRHFFEMLNFVDGRNLSLVNKQTNQLQNCPSFTISKLTQLGLHDSEEAKNIIKQKDSINKLAMLIHYLRSSNEETALITIENMLNPPPMKPISAYNNKDILKLLYSHCMTNLFLNICRKHPAISSLVMSVDELKALLPPDQVTNPNPKNKLTKSIKLFVQDVYSSASENAQMLPLATLGFTLPFYFVVNAIGINKNDTNKYVPIYKVAAFFDKRIQKEQAQKKDSTPPYRNAMDAAKVAPK